MSLALARQNPQEWMSSPISSSVPSQKASRVGKRLNNAGVTRFTRASVHWAESRTEMRSCRGSG